MPDSRETRNRHLTRRQFLPGAAGLVALGAAGAAGYELRGEPHGKVVTDTTQTSPNRTPVSESVSAEVQSFVTRPDLKPPVVRADALSTAGATEASPRFVALTPITVDRNSKLQSGPMLIDRKGRLVWFSPQPGLAFDLKLQSYKGQPVLAWWQGDLISTHGAGKVTIVDGSYKTLATITGGDGLKSDLHDLYLTSRGTALVTAYTSETADLTSRGGPASGQTWVGHVFEVDVASGKVLHTWNSLQHVPISHSYKHFVKKQTEPYDYFHLNSVSELADGSWLICARNTWAVYAVDPSSGKILWRMGGKYSDFKVPANAQFSWQHHVRAIGSSTMTVFDNGMNTGSYSKALVLNFDTSKRTVTLARELLYPSKFSAETLGSVQLFPDGRVFVGWGSQPYFSEYGADNSMTMDGQLPIGMRSYRAYLVEWVGKPTDRPAVAARVNPAGGFAVYASWNGATEIASWTVLAGKSASDLQAVGSQPWSGFETTMVVNSEGPSFAVVAVDKHGNELGRSEVV